MHPNHISKNNITPGTSPQWQLGLLLTHCLLLPLLLRPGAPLLLGNPPLLAGVADEADRAL